MPKKNIQPCNKVNFHCRLRIYVTHDGKPQECDLSARGKNSSENRKQENYDGVASSILEGVP